MDNNDKWKDDLLATADITQEYFARLPDEQKLFILDNKHIFYNVNGGTILNLIHTKYKGMAKTLKITERRKY